jgi:hypothetical protein
MTQSIWIALACLAALTPLNCLAASHTGKPADCSVARDPRRCAAKEKAKEACGELQGAARSACISAAMPSPDCSMAPDVAGCESKTRKGKYCGSKRGNALQKCKRAAVTPPA